MSTKRDLGGERLHLLTLEELQESPQEVLRGVCDFLGVSSDFTFDVNTQHNPSAQKTVPGAAWRYLRGIKWLRRAIRLIPRDIRGGVRNAVNPKGEAVRENHRLSRDQRRRFIGEISEDLQRLRNFYGVDTSRWNLSP